MDDFRTLRQLIVGWLLLLVALIPMNAQNGNVLGQVIRLPKAKGNIYQLLGASVLLSSAMALGYAPVLLVAGLCVGALSCVLSKALFAAMPKNAPGRVNQYKLFKK